ncbi:MAG: hypothetical protein EAZ95_10315 [Bacteroidetes bacterium]|nr:MAG: hypothetical protein EAZ95_10315 [Bacteroidota bacterium]
MIYTFYSYKGGVGRTHLLANLAAYLCHYRKRKVLLIDWDLEAPGLHFYFKQTNEEVTSEGLIDLCEYYVEQLQQATEKEPLGAEDLIFPTEENGYITNMLRNENGGKIDLLPATRYEKGYHARINNFDWLDFYDNQKGNIYLGWLKDELKKRTHYDYVFIDSRTGQNDYSGICNVMMPDMNIFVIAPNTQNFIGAKEMADRIIGSNYVKQGNRKPYILPVLWVKKYISKKRQKG